MCGACWAFVATSSVEASISKNVDYFVTKDISSTSSSSSSHTHTHQHNHSQHIQHLDAAMPLISTVTASDSDIMMTITTNQSLFNSSNNSSDVNNGRHDKHDENDTKTTHTSNTPHGLSDNGAIALSVQELIDCDTEYDRGLFK